MHGTELSFKNFFSRNSLLLLPGLIIGLLIILSPGHTFASVIDPSRTIDWQGHAGVPGGIPNRTTICATLSPGADAPQINSAIQSCPANQVVFLNAGTYNLTGIITFNRKSNVTLRGAGPGKTILRPGPMVTTITSGQVLYGAEHHITGGNTKGSTSITVDDATGIIVGTILNIYQADDPDFYWTRSNDPDNTGQFVMVTAVNGNILILEDPLVWNFSLNPRFKADTSRGMRWSGIEDMTITADALYAGYMVQFWNTYATWVKNVEMSGGKAMLLSHCIDVYGMKSAILTYMIPFPQPTATAS